MTPRKAPPPAPATSTAKRTPARKKTTSTPAPRKRATKRAPEVVEPAKKRAPRAAKRTAATPAPPPPLEQGPDDAPKRGLTESQTLRELEQLKLSETALAASALLVARHLDNADTAAGAASAARELRMTMAAVRSLGNPLSPSAGGEVGENGSNVVSANRLEQLRKKAEQQPRKRGTRRAARPAASS